MTPRATPDPRPRRALPSSIGGILIIGSLALAGPAAAAGYAEATTRVSLATGGTQGNGLSTLASISADGRYIVFQSAANDLVAGDTNGAIDIFRTDTTTGSTIRVSVASDGTPTAYDATRAAISADGRYVVFQSSANNLVAADTNGATDVFLRDTLTGTTTRVSIATAGVQGNSSSSSPAISADGRHIAFHSTASNLVVGDTNSASDVFVRDTVTGTTTRVNVTTAGAQTGNLSVAANPAISADGRYIVFESTAADLVPGDTNGYYDIFVRDTVAGITTRVNTASDGTQADTASAEAAVSADGRYIAFRSHASNLVPGDTNAATDIFIKDTLTGTTTRVSAASDGTQSNSDSFLPSLSADGRYVAYESYATNLVTGDTNGARDIFLTEIPASTTARVNVSTSGAQTDAAQNSANAALSADGSLVVYESVASNLVAGDTNSATDIFLTTMGQAPVITAHPANATVHAGDTATFTVAYSGAGTVQWQQASTPTGTWTDIPGATSTTLDYPTTTAGVIHVRAAVTNPGGTVTSNAATLIAEAILPRTGADATIPLAVAGALLVAGAGALLLRRRLRH